MEEVMKGNRRERRGVRLLLPLLAVILLGLPTIGRGQDDKRVAELEEKVEELEKSLLEKADKTEINDVGIGMLDRPSIGLGITAGASSIGGPLLGGHVVFSVQKNLHIGTQIGLSMESSANTPGRQVRTTNTSLLIAPYTKLFFPLQSALSPFLIGGLEFEKRGNSYSVVGSEDDFGVYYGNGQTGSTIRSSLYIGAGAEYFASRSLGIYGYFGLLEIDLGSGERRLGLLGPRIGIEWFLL